MKTKAKTCGRTLAAAALALTLTAGMAHADAVPGNNSDSFTVRITPNVDLGVDVDTTGSAWAGSSNLDATMNLGASLLLGTAVKATVLGNFVNQELEVQGAANDTWALDTDASDETDKLRLYALFGIESGGASPASDDFADDVHLITTGAQLAGQTQPNEASDTGHVYETLVANAQYQDVDGMVPGTTRLLWLRADTPSSTSSDGQQTFTVTLTAKTGAGQ